MSNILFNPKIGEEILRNMTIKAGAYLQMETSLDKAVKCKSGWELFLSDGKKVHCSILVDGTELGDVAESLDVAELKDRITAQDLTYVAILKDYGHPVGMEKPEGYDISFYRNCCDNPQAENIGGMNPMGQQLWRLTLQPISHHMRMTQTP